MFRYTCSIFRNKTMPVLRKQLILRGCASLLVLTYVKNTTVLIFKLMVTL
jgi:hypothetical protein